MSYNPGGWTEDKVKALGILLAVVLVGVFIAQACGWIHIDPPKPITEQH